MWSSSKGPSRLWDLFVVTLVIINFKVSFNRFELWYRYISIYVVLELSLNAQFLINGAGSFRISCKFLVFITTITIKILSPMFSITLPLSSQTQQISNRTLDFIYNYYNLNKFLYQLIIKASRWHESRGTWLVVCWFLAYCFIIEINHVVIHCV